MPLQIARRNSPVVIPNAGIPGSSDTESDSQRTSYIFEVSPTSLRSHIAVTFIYPSQLNETELSSTVPQKRARPLVQDGDSSETEAESQGICTLYLLRVPGEVTPCAYI